MTSPNTIIADLSAEVESLRKQRDELLAAISMIEPSNDFYGWESADGEPIGKEINACIARAKGGS